MTTGVWKLVGGTDFPPEAACSAPGTDGETVCHARDQGPRVVSNQIRGRQHRGYRSGSASAADVLGILPKPSACVSPKILRVIPGTRFSKFLPHSGPSHRGLTASACGRVHRNAVCQERVGAERGSTFPPGDAPLLSEAGAASAVIHGCPALFLASSLVCGRRPGGGEQESRSDQPREDGHACSTTGRVFTAPRERLAPERAGADTIHQDPPLGTGHEHRVLSTRKAAPRPRMRMRSGRRRSQRVLEGHGHHKFKSRGQKPPQFAETGLRLLAIPSREAHDSAASRRSRALSNHLWEVVLVHARCPQKEPHSPSGSDHPNPQS